MKPSELDQIELRDATWRAGRKSNRITNASQAAHDRCALLAYVRAAENELKRLDELINSPHIENFLQAVQLEAAHQRERWGAAHDADKEDAEWFWLIGYLGGKAIRPDATPEKRLHHIITTAAACLNWHAARTTSAPGEESKP